MTFLYSESSVALSIVEERRMQPAPNETVAGLEDLIQSGELTESSAADRFKVFLDQVPVPIAVSMLKPAERIVYANVEFERLTNQTSGDLLGGVWERLPGAANNGDDDGGLGWAVSRGRDFIGSYIIAAPAGPRTVDAWSNIIDDDHGKAAFRLVVLTETGHASSIFDQLQAQVREKDLQLRELQHRVKNNLQMITALIRMEARGVTDASTGEGFDRLAGRVEALGLLYRALSDSESETVDLGIYLTEIATAVMRAHAVEGIRLDLEVVAWPVTIDVAMPAGLVVNELMTNALKHAFEGREAGTITLQSVISPTGCVVVVADDGVGLPEGVVWPKPGKLSAMIVRSLIQNARASVDVKSSPEQGTRVTIGFECEVLPPPAAADRLAS